MIFKIIIVICMLLFCFIISIDNINHDSISYEDTLYQGPVPEDCDVDHFRKTGGTIKINEEDDGNEKEV